MNNKKIMNLLNTKNTMTINEKKAKMKALVKGETKRNLQTAAQELSFQTRNSPRTSSIFLFPSPIAARRPATSDSIGDIP
jgi:hypothetical protein